MLIKLSPFFPAYARHNEERIEKAITKAQWIAADRLVMMILLITVIAATVIFS